MLTMPPEHADLVDYCIHCWTVKSFIVILYLFSALHVAWGLALPGPCFPKKALNRYVIFCFYWLFWQIKISFGPDQVSIQIY